MHETDDNADGLIYVHSARHKNPVSLEDFQIIQVIVQVDVGRPALLRTHTIEV